MWVARLTALLLPLGIWLILSAAAPRAREGRIAASGLLAFATSTLLYAAMGFCFMFGGVGTVSSDPGLSRFVTYYSLPVDNQSWGIIGLRGFLLDETTAPAALNLFISYLPIVTTCALLIVSLMAQRTGLVVQMITVAVMSGIILPIAGFWLWGGGWLGATGANLSLGHGAVDVGGLTTAALVAGGAGLAWLVTQSRRDAQDTPALPPVSFPFRALSGAFFALIGAGAFVAGNPLLAQSTEKVAGAAMLNLTIAACLAAIVALAYSAFVSRHTNLLLAARAFVAALICVAAGSMLLPTWAAAVSGVIIGLLTSVGLYLVREVLHWHDDAAIVSAVLFPALLGFILIGLLANGIGAQGWNGVGAQEYLGINGLGIVGALAGGDLPADPGQLTAQVAAAAVVLAFSFIFFLPFALVLRGVRAAPVTRPAEEQEPEHWEVSQPGTVTTAVTVPVVTAAPRTRLRDLVPLKTSPRKQATNTPPPAPAQSTSSQHRPPLIVRDENTAGLTGTLPTAANPVHSAEKTDATTSPPQEVQRRESLLDRLRRWRSRREPEPPSQARHVAYPVRFGGRRIAVPPLRPIDKAQQSADDTGPAT